MRIVQQLKSVLEHQECGLEIGSRNEIPNHIVVRRLLKVQQHHHALELPRQRRLFVKRIDCKIWPPIAVLWLLRSHAVSANRDGARRPIEMKQRVNMIGTGNDRTDVGFPQQLDLNKLDLAQQKMLIQLAIGLEAVTRMDARPGQNLKGSGETMLMNVSGAVEPIVDVDIEP